MLLTALAQLLCASPQGRPHGEGRATPRLTPTQKTLCFSQRSLVSRQARQARLSMAGETLGGPRLRPMVQPGTPLCSSPPTPRRVLLAERGVMGEREGCGAAKQHSFNVVRGQHQLPLRPRHPSWKTFALAGASLTERSPGDSPSVDPSPSGLLPHDLCWMIHPERALRDGFLASQRGFEALGLAVGLQPE